MTPSVLALRPARAAGASLEQDAARERVSARLAWAIFWFPLAGLAALLAAAVIFRPAYDRMLQEDYPVEWGQFALCAFVSILSGLSAYHAARGGRYLIALTLLALALGTVVLAGEEISWGQRVFGIATPAELEGINDQQELNLHNITTGFDLEAAFRTVALLIGVVGTVVPLLTRVRRPVLWAEFWQVLSPPLFTVPLFAMMIGYRVYRLFTPGEINFAVRLQEWPEFCQYLGLAVTVSCIYLAARTPYEAVNSLGRHARRHPGDRDVSTLIALAGGVLVVTLVFAAMTVYGGMTAGNAL